jgi:ATP-binding protein involved in chromosome partitioning
VTTPQAVAAADVSKSLDFCRQLEIPVLGLVENMSGFVCPHCGTATSIFSSGAGESLAEQHGVPLLGKIPIDPRICACGDDGTPFVFQIGKTPVGEAFREIALTLLGRLEQA